MENEKVNIRTLQFSPHAWWKAVQRGVELCEVYGARLVSGYSFKEWLQNATIEHSSLNLIIGEQHPLLNTDTEYLNAIENLYYDKVGFFNQHGSKLIAKTVDDLRKKSTFTDESTLFYTYKIDDLFHFITLHFQHWLLFNDFFHWVKWQLYYDFIIAKSDKITAGLFQRMWVIILSEIDFNHQIFTSVEQYKKFRDKLVDFDTESIFIEDEFYKLKEQKEGSQ